MAICWERSGPYLSTLMGRGASKHVVDSCVGKFDEAGYRWQPVTPKSDGETAITTLRKAIAAARTGTSPLVESPVRESKVNGADDSAVKLFSGHLRHVSTSASTTLAFMPKDDGFRLSIL